MVKMYLIRCVATDSEKLQSCRVDEGLVVRHEAGSQQCVPARGCQ